MSLRLLLSGLCLGLCCGAVAVEKSPAEIFPPTVIAYVEVPRPAELIATILDHPARAKVEALREVQKALQSPGYRELERGLAAFEKKAGMSYRAAVEALTANGVYVGVDAFTQGAVTIVQAKDAATLDKLLPVIHDLARAEATRQGKDDPIHSAEYQGQTIYRAGDARWTAVGSRWVLANKEGLLKQTIDRLKGAAGDSLADEYNFQTARKTIAGKPTAWAYVNFSVLRTVGVGKELFAPKSDNPVAELLAGGIASTLTQTPFITAAFNVNQDRLALAFAAPHDKDWIPERRQFFFGAAGPALDAKDALLSLSLYRDLGTFWLLKEDLFTENVVAQLTQADSNLTTIFSGRDFGRDVLGAVGPEMQLLVARQTFADGAPRPDIKLPAGALVLRLKEPEKMQRSFKVLFQSLIGFLNIVGSQQAQPPLEQDTEKLPNGQLLSAKYLPDAGEGKINFNFSPSMAFAGDRLILSTATSLARELAAAPEPAKTEAQDNARATVSLPVLRTLLDDNRKHLVAQSALNDGISQDTAEKNVSEFLSLLTLGKSLGVRLITEPTQVKLEAEVRLETR